MNPEGWQSARVIQRQIAAEDMLSLTVAPSIWRPHLAGQHYELHLPSSGDSRKYSVVSSPSRQGILEFGIQRLPHGLVSRQLWELAVGDSIELRQPVGESFIWSPDLAGPLVLIGGGSGVTPLLAIYDHFKEVYPQGQVIFIMSAKNPRRIMHYARLQPFLVSRFTETQSRISPDFLTTQIGDWRAYPAVRVYICGSPDFIDSLVDMVLDIGFPPGCIRSERFI